MKITVYANVNDPYSDMLKNLLKFYGVSFENIEVSRNPDAMKTLIEVSGQSSTPVLVVDGKVFIGFDREKMKEVLGLGEKKNAFSY